MYHDLDTIYELVRNSEHDLTENKIQLSKYVQWNLFDNNNRIDAYLNSRHISGDTDAQGREKPFFNIVTAAVNIWYRATDIDRKNIRIKADKKAHYILSFLATILLSEWMRKNPFGQFLNEWGRALCKYGSIVCKFVEKDGELYSEVIPWNRMICDQIDFENNVQIEKLWLTPAQLRKNKNYNQEYVEQIIDKVDTNKKLLDNETKENKTGYIPVYEVHGELPLSYLTDKEGDDDTFVQQMHVVCFEIVKEDTDSGKSLYDDYTLYHGKETQSPYYLTHLIKEDGRVQSVGAVESLFEAQWMMNHTAKLIKDQLDLASKLIYQTADTTFAGQNALTSIQNGDVLIHELNKPLTQINNGSHDITQIQNYGAQWKALSSEQAGISEAMLGANPPSGSAWRQTRDLLQENHSLFELMTENKGLQLEEIIRRFVIPHLKKKMNTSGEISAILNEYQLKKIDSLYLPNEVIRRENQKIVKDVLSKSMDDIRAGKLFTSEQQVNDMAAMSADLQGQLNGLGNQRFIKPSEVDNKTWKAVLKDFEWNVRVEITNEEKDVQAVMQTLSQVLQTIAGLQGQPMSEDMRVIFNKILEETGAISSLEFQNSQQAQPMPQQTQQPVPAMAGQ